MSGVTGFVLLIVSQFRRIRNHWTGEDEPDMVLFATGLIMVAGALIAIQSHGKRQQKARSVRHHRGPRRSTNRLAKIQAKRRSMA
jgi:hypothetical protein